MRRASIIALILISFVAHPPDSFVLAGQQTARAQELFDESKKLLAQGEVERAISLIEEAIKVAPTLTEAYSTRWLAMLKRPEFEAAIPLVRREVEALLERSRKQGELRETALRAAASGLALIGDDEAQAKVEDLLVAEFPESDATRKVLFRRAFEEKDFSRQAALIEDYLTRYPGSGEWALHSTLFRARAIRTETAVARLIEIGKGWIESSRNDAYQTVEARAALSAALAARLSELDYAQGVADEAVRFAESLGVDSQILAKIRPAEREGLIALLRERARAARGLVLLKRGKTEEAAADFHSALQAVLKEVERNGFIAWKDLYLTQVGALPRVLWLAELYEAQGNYERAARYLLAGYGEDARANAHIRERLPVVYEKLGRSRAAALAKLEEAELRAQSLRTSTHEARGGARKKALANRLGIPAPDFKLMTLDKKRVAAGDLKGKVVVLNFWATWCGPCVEEMPHYQGAADRYRQNPDVIFLAISIDDNRAVVRPFIEKRGYRFMTGYDDGAAESFKVKAIPATIIIDGNGIIQFRDEGFGGTGEAYIERIIWRVDEALKTKAGAR